MDASVAFSRTTPLFGMAGSIGGRSRSLCSLQVKKIPSSSSSGSLVSRSNSSWQNDHLTRESVGAIILGDVETQPNPITRRRSIGAVPFAANYRLIDVVASNCINSNISKIYTISQFNSTCLNSHMSRSYSRGGILNNTFVDILAPYSSSEDDHWFQGTADAIRQCLWILDEQPVTDFLIVPAHHVYRMNYQEMIDFHRKCNAEITIAGSLCEGGHDDNCGHGFIKMNDHDSVINFKMDREDLLKEKSDGDRCIRSMGMYILKREAMIKLLTQYFPKANELDGEVIPGAISKGMKIYTNSYNAEIGCTRYMHVRRHVEFLTYKSAASPVAPKDMNHAPSKLPVWQWGDVTASGRSRNYFRVDCYLYDGYWEEVRSVKAFYRANMEIVKNTGKGMNLYDSDEPVYTLPRCLPPSSISKAEITESIIGDGCMLKSCKIRGSVIGMRTFISEGVVIEDSVVMGADIYQPDHVNSRSMGEGTGIPIGIGKESHIRTAVVDKNARIGKNVKLLNVDNVQEGGREEEGIVISEGIVIVLEDTVVPDGSII